MGIAWKLFLLFVATLRGRKTRELDEQFTICSIQNQQYRCQQPEVIEIGLGRQRSGNIRGRALPRSSPTG